MGKYDKMLWRACMASYGVSITLILSASVVWKLEHRKTSVILCAIGLGFWLLGNVASKLHAKASRANVDRLRQAFDEIDYVPTQATDHEWLDREKLHVWTTDLSELGFSSVGDYTVGCRGAAAQEFLPGESFMRLMASDRDHSFAEISQSVLPTTDVKAIACSMLTIFSSGDDCRTSNCAAPPEMVRKYIPTGFYEQGASPRELLRIHLEQRDKLASEQGLVTNEDVSYDVYHQHTSRQKSDARERANRMVSELTGKDCDLL